MRLFRQSRYVTMIILNVKVPTMLREIFFLFCIIIIFTNCSDNSTGTDENDSFGELNGSELTLTINDSLWFSDYEVTGDIVNYTLDSVVYTKYTIMSKKYLHESSSSYFSLLFSGPDSQTVFRSDGKSNWYAQAKLQNWTWEIIGDTLHGNLEYELNPGQIVLKEITDNQIIGSFTGTYITREDSVIAIIDDGEFIANL